MSVLGTRGVRYSQVAAVFLKAIAQNPSPPIPRLAHPASPPSLPQVAAQPNATVSLLKLDQTAIKAFIDRLPSPSSDGERNGGPRVGLLFGRYNATSRHVSVDVIFEPVQHSKPNSKSGGYDESALEGPEAQRASKVAAMLGLVPVGWVLANAQTGHKKGLAPQVRLEPCCESEEGGECMPFSYRDCGLCVPSHIPHIESVVCVMMTFPPAPV